MELSHFMQNAWVGPASRPRLCITFKRSAAFRCKPLLDHWFAENHPRLCLVALPAINHHHRRREAVLQCALVWMLNPKESWLDSLVASFCSRPAHRWPRAQMAQTECCRIVHDAVIRRARIS